MSTEQNKQIVRRTFEAISSGDASVASELFASNWVNIDPGLPPMKGIEGAKQLLTMFHAAMPGNHFRIDTIVAEGEKVAVNFTFTGTHKNVFLGIPPTGKSVSVTGTGIFRLENGKLVENRVVFDAAGLMQQLGVVPAPNSAR